MTGIASDPFDVEFKPLQFKLFLLATRSLSTETEYVFLTIANSGWSQCQFISDWFLIFVFTALWDSKMKIILSLGLPEGKKKKKEMAFEL